jgi:D-serine deaminase-like pyridoxal phosphate-dependent protein
VPHRRTAVHVAVQRALRRLRVAVECDLGEHRSGNDWSGTGEEAPTRKFRHD